MTQDNRAAALEALDSLIWHYNHRTVNVEVIDSLIKTIRSALQSQPPMVGEDVEGIIAEAEYSFRAVTREGFNIKNWSLNGLLCLEKLRTALEKYKEQGK